MLSKFSVKKPFTVVVAVIMVFILGAVSFMNMTTDLLPNISIHHLRRGKPGKGGIQRDKADGIGLEHFIRRKKRQLHIQ